MEFQSSSNPIKKASAFDSRNTHMLVLTHVVDNNGDDVRRAHRTSRERIRPINEIDSARCVASRSTLSGTQEHTVQERTEPKVVSSTPPS